MFGEDREKHGGQRSVAKKEGEPVFKLQVKELPPLLIRPFGTSLSTAARHASYKGSEYQSIDDMTNLLSRTHIDQRESTKEPGFSIAKADHQGKATLDQLIREVLPRDLKVAGSEMLLPSHACFELARQYAKKWQISDYALDSHIKLACGYLKFPVILLLNPAPTHEFLPFDRMVDECKTLRWIGDVLHGIGLNLADVMILDCCTLLSNDYIRELAEQKAYDVTQRMLEMIKPNIILSCQCSTSFSQWGRRWHMVSRELCSSINRAKEREVKEVKISGHTVNVVQAYHPSGFLNLNRRRNSRAHHDPHGELLKYLFQKIYNPCATWKSHHIMALRASASSSLNTSTNILTGYKKS
ncbi:hypothetical protein N431DRAFT_549862 [Stipitochalara longipes BDJ]|nr:hypothetical protein N431DRAFT_549862 [Stipitochalara longipes BDJ]